MTKDNTPDITARPPWLTVRAPQGKNYEELTRLVEEAGLHTVCQSAHCPNIGECWHSRTATFMVLGDICTRNCRFCAVTSKEPGLVDPDEPQRVVDAIKYLGLKHAVITSVTRDDLPDGGASHFAQIVSLTHKSYPDCIVEVLIPDFQGDIDALQTVIDSRPAIINHNVETVERLYPSLRPQADYKRSLDLLRNVKKADLKMRTKSGIMVGAGETMDEVIQTISDIRATGCDILTVGQYLAPSSAHAPIDRYCTPDEFAYIKEKGLSLGFLHVESGPLVRSSYHAAQQIK